MNRVLLLIPTYNEAANIRPLVAAVDRAFAGSRRSLPDILFIDDNSPDGTAEVIEMTRSLRHNIHILSGNKAGLGRAYIRGMRWGLRAGRYDAFVMMDADLSHDPADIPRLLARLDKGSDYVIGSRYVSGGRVARGYSARRHAQSLVANRIATTLLDVRTPVRDLTAGFKAIRAAALQDIPLNSLEVNGYVFQVCLLYQFLKRGFRVSEVPTTFRPRASGDSKLGWRDVSEFLLTTYRLNPSARLQQAVRFAVVGASGTVVNLLILLALVQLAAVEPRWAYIAALEGSILSNFVLNHLFTFRRGHSADCWYEIVWKALGYNSVALLGAAIAWITFTVSTSVFGLHYVLADLLGIALAMGWNYAMSVKVIWAIVDDAPPALAADELQEV